MNSESYADLRDGGMLYGTVKDDLTASVDMIWVYPNETGKGIGSAMLTAFTEFCLSRAITRITVVVLPDHENERESLERFYYKNGFIDSEYPNKKVKQLV